MEPDIRTATIADLDQLVELEVTCFSGDRMSRRSYHHLLTRGNGTILIAMTGKHAIGAVVLCFHRGSRIARLYSIAVAPTYRQKGLGRKLVFAAESVSKKRNCDRMRLEIKQTNVGSLALFTGLGYTEFGRYLQYYEDGEDAVRVEKALTRETGRRSQGVDL